MKAPENFTKFASFEEKIKKYKEWDFPTGKKEQPPELLYKGVFSDCVPEKCEIVGYTDMIPNEMVVVIHLLNSDKYLPIDRRYLKQMQQKNFRIDQEDLPDTVYSERVESGKELKKAIDDYVVYDIETTGFSPENDEIIEIAAIKISKGKVVEQFESLVHPSCEISRKIIKLTGIDNIMVANAPEISDVLKNFVSFIGDSIILGHNIKRFDNVFIANALQNSGLSPLKNDFIDTLTISRKLLPELKSHILENLIDYYQIEKSKQQHRALNDCEYTYQIYEKMKEKIIAESIDADTFKENVKAPSTKNSSKSSKSYPKYEDLRQITSSKTSFNENHPLFGKNCAFTGELKKYSREEAAMLIVDLGGKCENNVTKKTNYLIVSDDSDKKSGKQKKAEEYKLKGQDIEIISESVFYDMLETE